MQSFRNAILAKDRFDNETAHNLDGLKESIRYALALTADKFHVFEQHGLTRDTLAQHDNYLEDASRALQRKELDILIPFVFNMGKAYSQLMADSLTTTTSDNDGSTAIEYAGKLSPILNFFYAQKARLYPTAMNEPSFKNE